MKKRKNLSSRVQTLIRDRKMSEKVENQWDLWQEMLENL